MTKPTTPKPIPIPRDLKPGDRLWYSKTEYATVKNRTTCNTPYFSYDDTIRAVDARGEPMFFFRDGTEEEGRATQVIRIERIASKPRKTSKPARVDRDAEVIEQIINTLDHRGSDGCGSHLYDFISKKGVSGIKRSLRAIARRLSGEWKL